MNSAYTSRLFVGGPWHGQRREVLTVQRDCFGPGVTYSLINYTFAPGERVDVFVAPGTDCHQYNIPALLGFVEIPKVPTPPTYATLREEAAAMLADPDMLVTPPEWRRVMQGLLDAEAPTIGGEQTIDLAAVLALEGRKNQAVIVREPEPVDMILHCPKCGTQHVDAPEAQDVRLKHYRAGWTNPPHRSHLCAECGHIWRPADVATNGVKAITTRGKDDSPAAVPWVLTARVGAALATVARLGYTYHGGELWNPPVGKPQWLLDPAYVRESLGFVPPQPQVDRGARMGKLGQLIARNHMEQYRRRDAALHGASGGEV